MHANGHNGTDGIVVIIQHIDGHFQCVAVVMSVSVKVGGDVGRIMWATDMSTYGVAVTVTSAVVVVLVVLVVDAVAVIIRQYYTIVLFYPLCSLCCCCSFCCQP